jgi:hypothetical protein
MMWLMLCLTLSSATTGASVVLGTIKRLTDAVYRLGHEDGRQSIGCGMYRPTLSLVSKGDAEVITLRPDH